MGKYFAYDTLYHIKKCLDKHEDKQIEELFNRFVDNRYDAKEEIVFNLTRVMNEIGDIIVLNLNFHQRVYFIYMLKYFIQKDQRLNVLQWKKLIWLFPCDMWKIVNHLHLYIDYQDFQNLLTINNVADFCFVFEQSARLGIYIEKLRKVIDKMESSSNKKLLHFIRTCPKVTAYHLVNLFSSYTFANFKNKYWSFKIAKKFTYTKVEQLNTLQEFLLTLKGNYRSKAKQVDFFLQNVSHLL
jgi:hypothetical protein